MAAALLLSGCGDAAGAISGPSDGGNRQNDGGYTFFDASFYSDGGSDAGALPDGSIDGGAASCPGACSPVSGSMDCGADVCVLAGAAPACVASAGGLAVGDPCTDVGQCGAGLACFKKNFGGICGVVCCAAEGDSGCDALERCGGPGVLVDDTQTEWAECLPRRECDAVAQTGCQVGEGCYFIDAGGLTDCREEGTLVEGEVCVEPQDCAPGLTCLGLGVSTCRTICDDDDDCAGPSDCVDANFPGLPDVGHCS